jgi:hypothetical protein
MGLKAGLARSRTLALDIRTGRASTPLLRDLRQPECGSLPILTRHGVVRAATKSVVRSTYRQNMMREHRMGGFVFTREQANNRLRSSIRVPACPSAHARVFGLLPEPSRGSSPNT